MVHLYNMRDLLYMVIILSGTIDYFSKTNKISWPVPYKQAEKRIVTYTVRRNAVDKRKFDGYLQRIWGAQWERFRYFLRIEMIGSFKEDKFVESEGIYIKNLF